VNIDPSLEHPGRGPALTAVAAALLLFVAAGVVRSQDIPVDDPAPLKGPAVAIAAQIDVERGQLLEDLDRFDRLTRRRTGVTNRATDLHRSLDAAVGTGAAAPAERVDELLTQLADLEAERAEVVTQELRLVETIRDRRQRIALLLEKLESMQGLAPREEGVLSGIWDVVLLPTEQRGVFSLDQSGTLVSGTYRLAGGWTGSLQGTLVNRKVFLVRIDSKLGRVMELEGFLSADEDRVRGTWLNYELAGTEGATGHWSAERRRGGS